MLPASSAIIKSPLADCFVEMGAPLEEYSGVETAASFGDAQMEFDAITQTCGIYDLSWRGKIAFSGPDRMRWLNGMVTNNIKDLPLNHGNYNFALSAQGRIQGDLYVYNRGQELIADTERSQVERLIKHLQHFIIMDDVELVDCSEKITSIGIQGPRSAELLKAVGIQPHCAEPMVVCDVDWRGSRLAVTRMASEKYLTYEIWSDAVTVNLLWKAITEAGAVAVGTSALEKFRVLAGVPKYGVDIREKHLPQETQQDHALNFSKGCYIGQEIVERIRSRANVHRSLTGFITNARVESGSQVTAGDKPLGEVTSVADVVIKGKQHHLALGYIRHDAAAKDSILMVRDIPALVASLPFKF